MKKYIINEERLKKLLEEENELSRLECAGVDNWEGYDYAFEDEFEEENKKEDLFKEFEEYNK